MIFSSPLSQSHLPTFTPNPQHHNSPSLSHSTHPSLFTASAASTATPSFSSSVFPPHLTSSPSSPAASSFYEVLGIPMGASSDEIKAAYRKLARVCHPDVAAKDAPADDFMRVHTAYSTLSDPVKRADYDRRLFPRYRSFTSLRTSASPASAPVYTRRNWETDQCW